jgi:hypothetical protein
MMLNLRKQTVLNVLVVVKRQGHYFTDADIERVSKISCDKNHNSLLS